MLANLKKLSREEVTLTNIVAQCSSMASQAKTWLPGVAESLSKSTNLACKLKFTKASIESKPKITGSILAVTWPPKTGFFWIECDTKTLQNCAYRAIGSTVTPEDPKLSDLETGIVMHLITRALESTKEAFQLNDTPERPTVPTLCLSFKFTTADTNSYIRLWISQDLLTPEASGSALELGKTRCLSAEFPLSIELGKVNLTPEEFKSLEPGDIIVLENSAWQSVTASVGDPAFKTLEGSIYTDEKTGHYSFSVKELS